jgi:outer membrane protein OmpA-like peptidoglycan-associated protein
MTPRPTASLEDSRQAIAHAERADAGQYAAWELNQARIKLAAANVAITEQRMVMADWFAAGSRAEAELATAKTEAAKANAWRMRDAVQVVTMSSEEQAAEWQQRIDEVQARRRAYESIATLGAVLFTSGGADLKAAAPVAGNDSAAGRRQNRRVEVIINNPRADASR